MSYLREKISRGKWRELFLMRLWIAWVHLHSRDIDISFYRTDGPKIISGDYDNAMDINYLSMGKLKTSGYINWRLYENYEMGDEEYSVLNSGYWKEFNIGVHRDERIFDGRYCPYCGYRRPDEEI